MGSFYIISPGERGVLITMGNPSMDAKTEGLHFKLPIIQSVAVMDVKTQKYTAPASAASKDLQVVSTEIAVNYVLSPSNVPELYKTIGTGYQDRIIQPMVQEVVKATTAKFTAEELITRRAEVKEEIKGALFERLTSRGIIIEEVSITNFDFSTSFNQAIESKVTAEQLKLKAERDLERIRIEADQKVVAARAEAEALSLQKQQVTLELIKLREIEMQKLAIEKWDGSIPSTLVNSQGTMFGFLGQQNTETGTI